MLLAATVDDSDSVFVDLLTYADLEALKSKRAGAPPRAALSSKTNNKRYLILTYAAEFDRVHYPLPLLHEDAPSADALRATVARLKRENAKLAAGVAGGDGGFVAADTTSEGLKIIGEENTKLREENDALRTQVRQLQRELSRAAAGAASAGAASLRGSTELAEFRSGAGSEREENLRAELKAVTTELRLMRRERDDANRAAQAAQTDAANAESSKRRMLARRQKELDAARDDASRRRETERELRVKVKDLSTQCDGLERRLRASGVNVYHSRPSSRAPSPGRVGYGASSRGDASRPRRESPAGSRAATPSRARARRSNPDPSRFHRVSNPDARAESETGDARTVADAASGGVVTGAKIRSHRVRAREKTTRRGEVQKQREGYRQRREHAARRGIAREGTTGVRRARCGRARGEIAVAGGARAEDGEGGHWGGSSGRGESRAGASGREE